jgi:SAM-dependent methyltransferase
MIRSGDAFKNWLSVMSIRSFLWQHLPGRVLLAYADKVFDQRPDRVYMRETIIPRIAGSGARRVLNIGVHYYTVRLHDQLTDCGMDVYTADVDAAKAMWGVKGSHAVCSALDLETCFKPEFFDAVILSGVLGYGIDSLEAFSKALKSIAQVTSPGGILVIGWDDNMFPDPLLGSVSTEMFEPYSELLGFSRISRLNGLFDANGFQRSKVYDILSRKP